VDGVDGKDRKHAPMGVFSVLAVRDGEKTPNSQNVPLWARFGCWARGAGWCVGVNEEVAEHQKNTQKGVFSMFGVRGMVREPPNTKNTSPRTCSSCLMWGSRRGCAGGRVEVSASRRVRWGCS